jgi:hypothetical protein
MNYGRLAGAAVAAAVVDMIYGFVVYGMLLQGQFALYPAIFRPADDMSHMPYLMLGVLIMTAAATYIYAKGYEGGPGVGEGVRFGAAAGVFIVGISVVNFGVMNIGRRITAGMAAAGFVEWLVVGAVIGLVYKPSAVASPRKAVGV